MVFRPKRSFGWLWLCGFGVLMFFFVWLMQAAAATEEAPQPWFFTLIVAGIVGLGLWFFVLAAMFPTMRYEVGEGELRLRYGLWTWRIPLASITRVKREDLEWTLWSSMRFPGFALYKVIYGGGVGKVQMCATRAAHGVLLIESDGRKYGVTPEDEPGFLLAIGRREEPSDGGIVEGGS